MSNIENSDLLKAVLKALYTTVARRTTESFAVAVIDTIISTIVKRYSFLKYVQINTNIESEDSIDVSTEINSVIGANTDPTLDVTTIGSDSWVVDSLSSGESGGTDKITAVHTSDGSPIHEIDVGGDFHAAQ